MFYTLNNIAYLLIAAGFGFVLLFGIFKNDRRLIICLGCAFALPICIAFLAPTILVANLLIGFTMLLFWRERSHFGAIYVFGLMTLPMVSQPLALGSIYLVDFSFGHAYTIAAFLGLKVGGHARKSMSGLADILVLLIVTVLYLAAVREGSATNALREFLNYLLSYILPYYIVSRSVQGPEQARSIMLALAGSAVVLSTLAIYETWRTWPIYRGIYTHYGIDLGKGANIKLRGGSMRSDGPYTEPLSLAFAITIGFVALLSLRQQVQQRWQYILLCVLVIGGLIAPQGRGAWIGAICALFALDLYRRNYRRFSIKIILIGIAGVMALALATINDRFAVMLGFTAEGQGTLNYREQLLTRGIEEFWKHPLFGDAIGDVLYNLRDMTQGEGIVDLVNGYLHIALISGAVGLMLIVMALTSMALQFLRVHNEETAPVILRVTTAFAFASLIAIAAMLTSMSLFGRPILILLIVAACGAGAARATSFSRRKKDRQELEIAESNDEGFEAILK